ncbi:MULTISPECIES: MobH family relaxase [Pseudomonas]|uniref:MobH family relaxase n=1 Tax=Pseudomonas TaxID=286 RepID=UPI000C86D84D|nr:MULTISPECIES: MobH family relaxase [Pseudomonas]MDQ2483300.1 MobH family relaxase [Pseudomonas putida]PMU27644.1 relaxase [Pseudomonas sp. GP01-A9]PMU32814.1 relaxase [Pseudomonas sp. GP01-A13]PMU45064.1 relaxase [Pseudomonas sp. GP01-A8]PMU56873.1 relaxase [Pseudomonas sp. GP01-A14]
MLSLFQRKRVLPIAGTPPTSAIETPKGSMRPESAASLLATPRRQKLLEHIWQRTSLSRRQFATLYLAPLERYAELAQQFPASENHHHAYPGGMLDHGLEIVAYALKLRQSYLLPSGTTPEDQAAQSEAWTAATAYAALLHDIGKIAVDLHVELADGSIWHPWHGPLQQRYRFRYRPDREYRLHSAAAGLLYARLLDREILDWLSGYPLLWSALLFVLAGQYEHAGVLGELVIQADRASVAQALGGDPVKAMVAPKHALQRKLLEGLRYLLKEELKLNQPQASDGWLTQDALWLVSKTVSDKLRAHLLSQGIDGIPANNTAVFNVLQDHGMLQPTPDGKAIWRATIASGTGWSHGFTLLRLAPALIWEGGERPAPFAGTVTVIQEEGDASAAPVSLPPAEPSSPESPPQMASPADDGIDALLDLLGTSDRTPAIPSSATESPPPAPEGPSEPVALSGSMVPGLPTPGPEEPPSGEHFIVWLRRRIEARKLIINDAKALVHTVADTAYLVSPGVFQRYAQEHPKTASLARQEQLADWQWVQKRFEKLQLHRKQVSGLNIWTCEVTGPRKSRRVHGYLLQDPRTLFNDTPPNNPYLSLSSSGSTQ